VRPCEQFEFLPEPFGAGELELRSGLIMEVCPDGGQVRLDLNAKLNQIGGGTDAAAEQDLRRAVHAGGENDEVRAQLTGLPINSGTDAEGTTVRDQHSFHGRLGHDRELAAVRTRSRYAKAVFHRTPSPTFIGSGPQPTPPSRSSTSSVHGMPAATAAPRNPRWNGWISSGEKRRTRRRSTDLANRGRTSSQDHPGQPDAQAS